jgi:hypothetical protein
LGHNDEVIVDYDEAGAVVGLEIASVGPDAFSALVEAARSKNLDLSALVSRSFEVSPAARSSSGRGGVYWALTGLPSAHPAG